MVTIDDEQVTRLANTQFELLRRRDGIAYLRTDLEPETQVVSRTFPQIAPGLKVDPRPAGTRELKVEATP